MVPIAIGLNINWVAIGDRFNLFHVELFSGKLGLLVSSRAPSVKEVILNPVLPVEILCLK